jgi:hypothetical protein
MRWLVGPLADQVAESIAPSRSGGRDALIEALNLAPDFLENLVLNKHPDTRRLKATPDLPTSGEPSSVMVGEAGDFTSLIGIPLQSPVLQQAGAFLLGRHHQHIKGQRLDPPLIGDGVCL